jgi:hypothetical protein
MHNGESGSLQDTRPLKLKGKRQINEQSETEPSSLSSPLNPILSGQAAFPLKNTEVFQERDSDASV